MIKTRSSSGVGQKIFLAFSNKSLLISDSTDEHRDDDGPDDAVLLNTDESAKIAMKKREEIMNRHREEKIKNSQISTPTPVITKQEIKPDIMKSMKTLANVSALD